MALKRIQDHFLVPEHSIVPREKVQEVLSIYGANTDKIPQIFRNDPAVEEIGAKKGDLVRIVRNSRTAGKSTYYRIVV